MRATTLASLVAIAALLVPSANALAQADADAQLAEIRDLSLHARFEDAIRASRTYLNRADLDAEHRNAGLEVLATAQLANRQRDEAAQTLQLLYSRDPRHRLADADASPPVISAFARARESSPSAVPVSIEHRPPTLSRREPPTIHARITAGDDAVAELQLVYRSGGEDATVVMTRQANGAYRARIPVVGEASSATDVDYHLVALAPSRAPLSTLGSAAEPLRVRIPSGAEVAVSTSSDPEPERPPGFVDDGSNDEPAPAGGGSVAEEWWFWTILVVLVAGGVTTGVLLGTGALDQAPQTGTLGTVRLMQVEF